MYNMHIHKYIRMYMCTYMYIERERERDCAGLNSIFLYFHHVRKK